MSLNLLPSKNTIVCLIEIKAFNLQILKTINTKSLLCFFKLKIFVNSVIKYTKKMAKE